MKEIVYVGGYEEEGLSVLAVDADSGTVEIQERHKAINASYLVVANSKKYLYVVHEVDKFLGGNGGGVSSYRIKEDGGLEFMNSVGTKGKGPCHIGINAEDRVLFVANYGEGTVCLFGLDDNGRISNMLHHIKHTGSSVNKERQDMPHAHFAIEIPQTNKIAMCDLGLDKVFIYGFDEDYIDIVFRNEVKVKAGSGPRHLAFHTEKRVMYVINELSLDISAYTYDANGEEFTWIQDIPLPDQGKAEDSAAAIRITNDNQYVLASVRGKNIIVTYKTKEDGTLERLYQTDVIGDCPRDICFNPKEDLLYCANQESNELVMFQYDGADGKLISANLKLSLEKPVCIGFK